MGELTTYPGNCHCGAYRFTVSMPTIEAANSCNCSLCRKTGSLWIFPEQRDITVTYGGPDVLRSYESSGARAEVRDAGMLARILQAQPLFLLTMWKFCPTCGTIVSSVHRLGPYSERPSINVSKPVGRRWIDSFSVFTKSLRSELCSMSIPSSSQSQSKSRSHF